MVAGFQWFLIRPMLPSILASLRFVGFENYSCVSYQEQTSGFEEIWRSGDKANTQYGCRVRKVPFKPGWVDDIKKRDNQAESRGKKGRKQREIKPTEEKFNLNSCWSEFRVRLWDLIQSLTIIFMFGLNLPQRQLDENMTRVYLINAPRDIQSLFYF